MGKSSKIVSFTACAVALAAFAGVSPALAATRASNSGGGGGNTTLSGNTDTTLLSQSSNVGPADPGKQMDISVILKTQPYNGTSLAQYIANTENPTSPQYHQFLTAAQFTSDFAPSSPDVQSVIDFLTSQGLTVTNTFSNNLVIQATGSIGAVEKAFNVAINQYQHGNKMFYANTGDPQVPSSIANLVLGITGMTTFTDLSTNKMNEASYTSASTVPSSFDKNGAPTEAAGQYGPAQVRSFYNINPLYQQGASGAGETIGIATLANFNPSDAYTYWQAYGVSKSMNRITVIPVDGGFPAGVHQPGAGETTLDVEQSGSMAPGAHIDVYEAPNTNPGFVDMFYQVAADDSVSVMSTSWGEAEQYETPAYHLMMNQAFEEGAAEGISMFASAGDSGAYDSLNQNRLAVDSPASDPYITAAGGTAYPANLGFYTIPQERVWGWDYILNNYQAFDTVYGANLSYGQAKSIVYPVGGGGGVSTSWSMPWYQQGVAGMNGTGRNVPDISLNADPFTGYTEYDTFGPGNNGWQAGWGGTSFVAPQLAGITALIDSSLGTRLGFLNPMLYQLASSSNAYGSATSPFHDITAGDNWYYSGVPGYDDGSGIGSLNVANLATSLAGLAPASTSTTTKHGH